MNLALALAEEFLFATVACRFGAHLVLVDGFGFVPQLRYLIDVNRAVAATASAHFFSQRQHVKVVVAAEVARRRRCAHHLLNLSRL